MSDPTSKFEEFLLAEYAHLASSMTGNEDAGEKRVAVFVTLTTAIGGALVVARENVDGLAGGPFLPFALMLLLAWLLVGVATLQRIIKRNLATQEYMRGMRRIRRYFGERVDERLRSVLPFTPFGPIPVKKRNGWGLGNGGFAEMVSLLNSMIAGAVGWVFTALFVFDVPPDVVADERARRILIGATVAAAGGGWLLQTLHVKQRYAEASAEETDDEKPLESAPPAQP